MNKFISKIRNEININYLLGLGISIIVPLLIMLLYWNKSIANYDGWYNLYAQDFLNGRLPYRDFHFLMPPVFLYIWTIIQKIFGDSLIVFHTASVVCKCLFSGALYYTFTRFYNYKISTVATLFSSAIMLMPPFDNCTFSYNEVVPLICVILINVLISFTNILYCQRKINYQLIILLAVINTILFFTKQTHGIIVPLGFLIIYSLILLVNSNIKTYLKTLFVYFLTSFVTSIIIFLPILNKNIITLYVSNVYLGASAKGSVTDILTLPLKIISSYTYIWPLFILAVAIFVLLILKEYNILQMKTMSQKAKSVYIPNFYIILVFSIFTICAVFFLNKILVSKTNLLGIMYSTRLMIDQIGAIAQYVTFFTALFYFVRFFITKSNHDAKRLILFGIFTLAFISITFSYAWPYMSYFIYGLPLCMLLNYKNKFQPLIEIVSFLFLMLLIFLVSWSKCMVPFTFHGYSSVNVATERKVSKLKFLKGFELSKQEVDIYENIYEILNKYLEKDDKIFCFINNTLFYKLFDREPFYDDNYNLYWDISPDLQTKEIYDKLSLSSGLKRPKVIIYFENPEYCISFHEKYFRNGSKDNYQRKIDILLKTFIKNKDYVVVKNYNSDNFYKNNLKFSNQYKLILSKNNELEKLYKNYNYDKNFDFNIYQNITRLQKEINEISKSIIKNSSDADRFFIDNTFNIKILVRKDVYYNEVNNK